MATPAAHHLGLIVGHAAFAGVVLKRVCSEQVDARQPVFEFGGTRKQIDQLFTVHGRVRHGGFLTRAGMTAMP